MIHSLPLNASDIVLKLCLKNGGTGIVATTDKSGLPYIGFYPLDWKGMPCGLPSRFQERHLATMMLVGYSDEEPVTSFIRAEVTDFGLKATLEEPLPLTNQDPSQTHFLVPWGSSPPAYRYSPVF